MTFSFSYYLHLSFLFSGVKVCLLFPGASEPRGSAPLLCGSVLRHSRELPALPLLWGRKAQTKPLIVFLLSCCILFGIEYLYVYVHGNVSYVGKEENYIYKSYVRNLLMEEGFNYVEYTGCGICLDSSIFSKLRQILRQNVY